MVKILTKELDISEWAEDFDLPEGSKLSITIKKIKFGDFTRMTEQMLNMKIVGKQQITTTSVERNQMLTLLYGIESAPFEISEKGIGEIPSDLGQFLYEEIESFNETRKGKNLKD
jgi:hypothetical protein